MFLQVCAKQYISLRFKFRKNKNYHQKRTAHWYTVTSVLLKPLKQRLIDSTSCRHSKSLYSRSVVIKRANNFGSVFTNHLKRRIYETKFLTRFRCLFLSYRLYFSFDAQNLSFIDCSHVTTLPVSW